MKIKIYPKKLKGNINCMPSKSYSHRAIIAASLAKGQSVIPNLIFSNDINATIEACRSIGAIISCEQSSVTVIGVGRVKREAKIINACESGSTIRFMIPICLTNPEEVLFMGENNLVKRPLDCYYEIFNKQSIPYEVGDDFLPMKVNGGLKPGEYKISGNISSQYITGLLYALPLLDGDSKISITTPLESKGYVDLTLDILKRFGIEVVNNNYQSFEIKGNQYFQPYDYEVEGDYSQAAFFLVGGLLGNDITVNCMDLNSYQADKKILEDIKSFNGKLEIKNNSIKAIESNLNSAVIDFAQSPDLGPILSVLASLTFGETKFINASRLRIKECDRITCMRLELTKLGAKVTETIDSMSFIGIEKFNGGVDIDCHNDHRIAMAFAVASTMCDKPIVLNDASCVKKSYPHFWNDFKKLGGEFDVID